MGKFLRALVISFLVFSIAALVLGILLFNRRELLKRRTQVLENKLIELGTTIEDAGAEPLDNDYESRDTSECQAEVIDTPERSDFWKSYHLEMEEQGLPTLTLQDRRTELMTFYKRDRVTNKILKDPATGFPLMKGEGTMHAVLEDLLTKAGEQLNRLNETREQLKIVREELITTIEELNKRKITLREKLVHIEELKAEIERLKGEIRVLKARIAELEAEIVSLQEEIEELQRMNALLEEEKSELQNEVEKLKKEISDLRKGVIEVDPLNPASRSIAELAPGRKGEVVRVNYEWNFAVIEMSDEFIIEVLGEDEEDQKDSLVNVELLVKRPGTPEKFVTKVRLLQVNKEEKLGVADILTEWQQLPVAKGDIVFFN